MFDNINDARLKPSLEVVLRYQRNRIELIVSDILSNGLLGNLSNLDHAKRAYAGLSFIARNAGVDTRDYDLTCFRIIERIRQQVPASVGGKK